MRFCAGCGAQWDEDALTCVECSADISITYNHYRAPMSGQPSRIEVQGEKGRAIGEAIGRVVAPDRPGVRLAFGVAGRFLGRRLAKGHPLIAIGADPEFTPEYRKPPKKKRKARKKTQSKQLTKKPRKRKKA